MTSFHLFQFQLVPLYIPATVYKLVESDFAKTPAQCWTQAQ